MVLVDLLCLTVLGTRVALVPVRQRFYLGLDPCSINKGAMNSWLLNAIVSSAGKEGERTRIAPASAQPSAGLHTVPAKTAPLSALASKAVLLAVIMRLLGADPANDAHTPGHPPQRMHGDAQHCRRILRAWHCARARALGHGLQCHASRLDPQPASPGAMHFPPTACFRCISAVSSLASGLGGRAVRGAVGAGCCCCALLWPCGCSTEVGVLAAPASAPLLTSDTDLRPSCDNSALWLCTMRLCMYMLACHQCQHPTTPESSHDACRCAAAHQFCVNQLAAPAARTSALSLLHPLLLGSSVTTHLSNTLLSPTWSA